MAPIPVEKVISGTEFTELRVRPDSDNQLSWIASSANGSELHIASLGTGEVEVHGLEIPIAAGRGQGGGAYGWHIDGTSVFYAAKDGSLVEYQIRTKSSRVIWRGDARPLAGVAPLGSRIAVVADSRSLMVVDTRSGDVRLVDESADFAFDPAWTIHGLVWSAWNTPHMPWESSGVRMWNGMRSRWLVRPGDSQIQQVRSIPGGQLGCVSDASGWLNVSLIKGVWRGRPRVLVNEEFEHAGPTWGMGIRSWVHDGDSVFFTRNEQGFGRLLRHDLRTNKSSEIGKGVHHSLCSGQGIIGAIRSGAKTPPQVVVYDKANGEKKVVSSAGDLSEFGESLIEPEVLRVGNITVRRYTPANPNGRHLVWVHGGPTDQWRVVWYPKFNYWLSRGYTIVVPDHRGTTGHGRNFQNALLGHWGEYDSNDIAAVIRGLALPPTLVAVVGGSAGGMTALNVVADHPDVACGVVVSYPVTDLAHLGATSHRFERHSVRTLVGGEENYRSRSPLFKAVALKHTPMLVMHGDADPVVPIVQGASLVEAVRSAGGRVEFEVMQGEGHGFRAPENKMREFHAMETFLDSVMGR